MGIMEKPWINLEKLKFSHFFFFFIGLIDCLPSCRMAGKSTKWGSQNQRCSNLQSFLSCTTPTVLSLSIPKAYTRNINSLWQPADTDKVEIFHLTSLWEQYEEWSAYGAGVPIRLNNGKSVVQYYTPYLSAIQIFTTKALSTSSESDSSSDESEKLSKSWDGVNEGSGSDHESSWLTREHIGNLYFEFSDRSSPYSRKPFVKKVYEFVKDYPGLKTLWSADLSPASWMSVAWYPIYHIPTQQKVYDLSACFLTYHTICALFPDDFPKSGKNATKHQQPRKQISLHPFGIAGYKMQGELWKKRGLGDPEKYYALYGAANSWLKQLKFQHHDFNYFKKHSF